MAPRVRSSCTQKRITSASSSVLWVQHLPRREVPPPLKKETHSRELRFHPSTFYCSFPLHLSPKVQHPARVSGENALPLQRENTRTAKTSNESNTHLSLLTHDTWTTKQKQKTPLVFRTDKKQQQTRSPAHQENTFTFRPPAAEDGACPALSSVRLRASSSAAVGLRMCASNSACRKDALLSICRSQLWPQQPSPYSSASLNDHSALAFLVDCRFLRLTALCSST